MYSFEPSDEQKMLLETLRRFAGSSLRADGRAAEEAGGFPDGTTRQGWELGLLQSELPAEFGGLGERSMVSNVLALEELGFGDLAGAYNLLVPALFAVPLLLAGSPGQREKYLPEFSAGGWQPFSAALMEYAFDFDANALKTTARMDGSEYVLDGEKACVPYARDAGALLIFAALEGRTQGFIVPRGTRGLTVQDEREKIMSLNGLPLYRVKLEGVRLPAADRLGGPDGHDFAPILAAMRTASAAAAVGVARAAFEYARDYARGREAFGVKIAQKQAIAFMLAEMCTEIEASRLLNWEAAWKLDQHKPDACEAAYLASTGAADMAMHVTDRAVQILGGHGYIREHPVEMWLRNARSFAVLTGLVIL
jgi:acyl-CoA dehydrogenase